MPFYLTNENIEATIERNPDDIFNPSDIDYTPQSKSIIQGCFLTAIKETFQAYIEQDIKCTEFCKVNSIQEDIYFSYLVKIETTLDEYKIMYHLPSNSTVLLQREDVLLTLSSAIIDTLNKEELSFLEDMELVEFSKCSMNKKELVNLYLLDMTISRKRYNFYLQFDNQFNKIF